ncbi:META domain-containing protein [Herbiconiux moechotypicola]|uniref:DUF306 domain-containing protein n=1 Tax=Herbiconiux moechotypicola TaxID=637393 RepID=A0ABP5Q3E5_9MICO|nr:META domain-containing protein [Herbiconiux moechotypicola]MCS5728379.1 META domain-containing protein [Herbiconiux moechotypicola]
MVFRSRTRTLLAGTALAAVALAVTACSGDSGGTVSKGSIIGTWVTGEEYDSPEVPFVRFSDDGTWIGSDGCNGAQGEWEMRSTGDFEATAGVSTLIACDGAAIPLAVTEAASVFVIDGDLELRDADGGTILALVDAPADMTEGDGGTRGEAAGTWVSEVPGASLVLDPDGAVSGSDGCNRLTGSWTEADNVVIFSGLASTLMACEGVDTWLSQATSFSYDGDEALVVGAEGTEIGTLTRQ